MMLLATDNAMSVNPRRVGLRMVSSGWEMVRAA
jgi:hypothetical protein